MHTLRYNSRLLLLPLAFLGLGCASTGGNGFGRSAEDKNVKTIASIGDRPISSSTGTPSSSSSAVANLDEPTRKSDDRDLVSGRVVDDQGDPVPNAKIRVADGGQGGGKVISAKTDRSGAFTLHGLRPGSSYTLIAEYEGRDGLVEGRSEVRSPNSDVEIALGGVDDAPANRRRASKSPSSRTVSDRQDLDEPTDKELDAKPLRLNREDMPSSRSDVEDIDDLSNDKTSSTTKRAGATAVAVSGWRRGVEATSAAGSTDSTEIGTTDSAARRVSNKIPPPDPSDLDDAPPTSRARKRRDVDDDLNEPPAKSASAQPEDDEDNPLPPAIHPERSKSRGASRDDLDELPPPSSRPAKRVSQMNTKSPGSNPGAFVLAKDEATATSSAGELSQPKPAARSRDLIDELPLAAVAAATETELATVAAKAATTTPFDDPFSDEKPVAPVKPRKSTTWGELESAWKKPEEAPKSKLANNLDRATPSSDLPAADPTKKSIEACRYDPKKRQIINFRLPDLAGKPKTLKDYDTDLIVLDFWGTWCRPCLNSVPHLVELQERLGTKRLTVIGIACEEGPAVASARHVSDIADQLGINYPVLLSSKSEQSPLLESLNITSFPTLIVLDKSGRILWRDSGASEMTLARLDRAVDPVSRASTTRR